MNTYITVAINEIRRKHNGHWFDTDTKRFFNSKWDSYALQNEGSIHAYFVSSEKHGNEDRKYTIRRFNMRTGDFPGRDTNTIFEFQKYTTKTQAEKALREHLKTEPIRDDLVNFLNTEIEQLTYQIKRTTEEIAKLKAELEGLTK